MKTHPGGYAPRYWRRLPEPRDNSERFYGECLACGHEHHKEYCDHRLLSHPWIRGSC